MIEALGTQAHNGGTVAATWLHSLGWGKDSNVSGWPRQGQSQTNKRQLSNGNTNMREKSAARKVFVHLLGE